MKRGWAVMALITCVGCQCQGEDLSGRQFACASDGDCVEGFACLQGTCAPLGSDSGAGMPDSGTDAGVDAGVDAGSDAGVDAGVDAGADAGVDAGVDAGPDTSCIVTLPDCPTYPQGVGTFDDNYEDAGTDQIRCIQRACDWYLYCKTTVATTASFVVNGTPVQTQNCPWDFYPCGNGTDCHDNPVVGGWVCGNGAVEEAWQCNASGWEAVSPCAGPATCNYCDGGFDCYGNAVSSGETCAAGFAWVCEDAGWLETANPCICH